MTQRYQQCFSQLKEKQQGAFVPFVMLGDPTLEQSEKIIQTLIDNGADALELGIPFSDPIADGPTIQASSIRALNNDATVKKCFQLLANIRQKNSNTPIGLLVYSNLVVGSGLDNFYQQASQSGVDSVLIADVPIIESELFVAAAKQANIQPIFIATPNADESTLQKVAKNSQGYTYLLSRAGVTGTDIKAEMPVERIIQSLKHYNAPPSLLGFGISQPDQVKQAIAAGAYGVISGSAVVNIIQKNLKQPKKMLSELALFTQNMKKATL